mmetsp:Transcript_9269/g.29842  ORF Transcript_9269/g.29842 Transcript_9269/m.29842 type:complete len:235 (-) Transcript_9269:1343-2047(-)
MTYVLLSPHMILPVCKSPCRSASHSFMNFALSSVMATLSSPSLCISLTISLSSCVHLLFSKTPYGSVKITCSVSAHMASLPPNAIRFSRNFFAPRHTELDLNNVSAKYLPTCSAILTYVLPSHNPTRAILFGGSMYRIAIVDIFESYKYTSGTCSGQKPCAAMSASASYRTRSCVNGHDSPTHLTYGNPCFRTMAAFVFLFIIMYTKLIFPSPTSFETQSSLLALPPMGAHTLG